MISKLILHLSKQDAAGVHVGLGEDVPLAMGALPPIEEPQDGDALHHAGSRVSKKFTPRLQRPVDADVVLGSHVEVAGLRGVVGRLFGDVVTLLVIWKLPVASEGFAKDGVEWLLDASEIWVRN